MRSISLVLILVTSVLISVRASTAQTNTNPDQEGIVELMLREIGYFERIEAALGSEPVQTDTVIYAPHPIRLASIYQRSDPNLFDLPLTIMYSTANVLLPDRGDAAVNVSKADTVVYVSYEWGYRREFGEEIRPQADGGPQPLERLGAFSARYESIRSQVMETLGPPVDSQPLSCSLCLRSSLGVTTWERYDAWQSDGGEVSMALTLTAPLVERPRLGSEEKIRVRVHHTVAHRAMRRRAATRTR
ncbi:MAG: hypothetical protein Rubg2KO_25810 [Rubricoccaceae bacterium]